MWKLAMNAVVATTLIFTGISLACSGTSYRLRGEETAPGVFNVLRTIGSMEAPGFPDQWDTVGTSKMSDFENSLDSLLTHNNLVFIGHIDSVIGNGLTNATAPPGIVPMAVLYRGSTSDTSFGRFYARLAIDTLIKGSMPSMRFWFEAYGIGSSCNVYPSAYIGGKFLNFSDDFTSIQDLKMPMFSSFCVNCPSAYWFDGRYLRSPDFPVLRLDITTIYPSYPATSIARRTANVVPWKPVGKAYRPDGRIAPEASESGRKSAVPVFK
jgi:hypothetical protein